MTITDMARMMMNADRYQCGGTQPKYPNGAAVSDPNAPDDGLDITGMTAADFHIIPVLCLSNENVSKRAPKK